MTCFSVAVRRPVLLSETECSGDTVPFDSVLPTSLEWFDQALEEVETIP